MIRNEILLLEPIRENGVIINFKGSGIGIKIIGIGDDGKPRQWTRCGITVFRQGSKHYHAIRAEGEGKVINRRNRYRQYLGLKGVAQASGQEPIKVVVKDISETGIGLILDAPGELTDIFSLHFSDEANGVNIDLVAKAVRESMMDNGNYLVGARIKKSNVVLPTFISMKQQDELLKRRLRGR